jgi:glycosyltransferase involved in cell wall biosynthesis
MGLSKVCIVAGFSRSLLNFRGPLLTAMQRNGHEVLAIAPDDECAKSVLPELANQGIASESIKLARGGLNPRQDLASIRQLQQVFARLRPQVVLAYTAKPVVYSGIAARRLGNIRFFPLITGLGYAFMEGGGLKRRLVRCVVEQLYRRSLAVAETVIFQNPDDERLFRTRRLILRAVPSAKVNGSGVDLESFPPMPLPHSQIFLMLARLVTDKGVREYVEAARIVRCRYPQAVFRLAGGLDPNPAGIKEKELQSWVDSGAIEYLGDVNPAQPVLAECRYYVLPSYYREGTPRSVLEAMATGRPIVTTDAPGCRETVENGVNGLLVPPRNAEALAEAMIQMLEAPDSEIQRMADASLAIVREKFDVHKVNQQMLEIMGL